MSRRSRKRGGSSGGNKWMVALVAVILVMVVAIGVVHTMIRRYLQSDEFRIFLSNKVSEAIQAEGQFKPLKWDGLAVRSDGFEAEGSEQLRMLNIEGLQTEIGLGGFWRGVWEVQGFQIRQVDLEIDARSGALPSVKPERKPEKKSKWLPDEVELKSMQVGRLSVKALMESGPAVLKDVRVAAEPGSGRQTYQVKLTGGKLTLPDERVPTIRLDEADLKYKDGAFFLSDATARFWDRGRLELTGEWDPELDIRGAQGVVSGVTCDQLVSEDWSKRLRGKLSTDFDVAWVSDEPVVSGHLVLQDGVLTALPILDVLEAYLDTTRFRLLTLNEAHADWRWREGRWSVSNLVVASEGLLRLEGDLNVEGENLDGRFRLGLAPGTLAAIPGAEKHVFLAGERGLRWAPVRVTGTLSDPRHDLTDRLIAAAGLRILEALPEAALESVLATSKVIDDTSKKALEEGLKALDGGVDVLEDTVREGLEGVLEGALQGVLGGF